MLNIFGLVSVKIDEGFVYIRGINSKSLFRDIYNLYKDRRFVNNVFQDIVFGIKFNQFFLPDIHFILQTLHDNSKSKSYRYKINKIIEVLENNTWLSELDRDNPPRLDFSKLDNLTITPLDHQMRFLEYYSIQVPKMMLKGSLLSAAAGSGKTFNSLATAECLDADRIIVISPLNAVNRVWESTVKNVYKKQQTYWVSTNKERFTNERIVIYHYEALNKAIEDLPELKKAKKIVVILDESHNFNEIVSLRTNLFIELIKELNTQDTILSTGTPVKALGKELIPLFKCIDPFFNSDAEATFKKIYSGSDRNILEVLNARLGKVSFKVVKDELNLEKPTIIDLKIRIKDSYKYTLTNIKKEMDKFVKEKNDYYDIREESDFKFHSYCLGIYEKSFKEDQASRLEFDSYLRDLSVIRAAERSNNLRSVKDEIVISNKFENTKIMAILSSEDKKRFKDVKTIYKYRSLKIQGECLGSVLGRFRINCHIDMVKGVDFQTIINDSLKKTVIFSTNTEVCEAVKREVENKEFTPVLVYGQYTKKLSESISKFESKSELNPLITTYASLSTAVPLVMANTIIMINLPFRAYVHEQAISRIHRIGMDTAVFIYQCILDTGDEINISTRGVDILKWSQEQVEIITGTENIFKDTMAADDDGKLTIASESLDTYESYSFIVYEDIGISSLINNW